jgi:hypothetical protein
LYNKLIYRYRTMTLIPILDNVLYQSQRQGRISFYMQSAGEEAAIIGSAAALLPTDEIFGQYVSFSGPTGKVATGKVGAENTARRRRTAPSRLHLAELDGPMFLECRGFGDERANDAYPLFFSRTWLPYHHQSSGDPVS